MRKRKLWILFAAEALVLLLCIVNLFRSGVDMEMDASFFQGGGVYDESRGGWYIDQAYGANEAFLLSGPLSVPAGVYKVELSYETDTDMCNRCTVVDGTASLGGIRTNGDHLYAGLGGTDYEVWVSDGNGSLQVQVSYGGTGYLLVKGVRIYDSGAMGRMVFFAALLLFACLDLVLWYRWRNAGAGMTAENKTVAAGLLFIIAVSSYPLLTDYIYYGGDLVFHLLRIEGIKDALSAGQFPVRIAPEWQRGYGYAASVFYGDTLLFIPALLRLAGLPIQTSYKIFLFVLNVGACLISYYAFHRIFRNKIMGVLCSAMYTLSVYRLFKMYYSAALGECISTLFIPLLIAGFYAIFTEDVKNPGYGRNWLVPVVGFCGMLQSHILSTYIASAFVVLLCVLLWKKVFRKETFLVLAKVVLITSLVSAWFVVPFLDYMSSGAFAVNHISSQKIQERGLQAAQLFRFFVKCGDNHFYYANGMVDADPVGLGGLLAAGLFLFLVLVWLKKTDNLGKGMLAAGKIAAFMGICAMAMSTCHFPWDRIQKFSKAASALVGPLILPSRFLNVATAALVFVSGVAGMCIWKMDRKEWKVVFCTVAAGLTILGGVYMLNDIGDTMPFFRLYNVGGMGTGYVSGGEYLPVGTDASQLTYRGPSAGNGVEIYGYGKKYLAVSVDCANLSPEEGYVDMPVLYYEGYRAESDGGERLEVCAGENNSVRVLVPGGYEGTVSVRFVSPWYWRAAELVSLFTVAGLAGGGIYKNRKTGWKAMETESL